MKFPDDMDWQHWIERWGRMQDHYLLRRKERFELISCELSSGEKGRGCSSIVVLLLLVVVVAGIVVVAHWPTLSAQVLFFDDDQYLTKNLLVQNPGWKSARRFLTEVLEPSTVAGYYQPLAMLSLMADYALGGRKDNLRPFHRTSLALHMANTALVIVLLYLLFGRAWVAAGVGLLFGVHPMTVEPIPWVGERKTLLAAFFALWCLILYVRFTRKSDWRLYAACLVMYVLALMSKPTSTPLPALMLLLDFWPLRRLNRRTVLEKLPFFVVGGVLATIIYVSQSRTAGVVLPGRDGAEHIPLIPCHNIIFYLYKIVWPINLSSHYAYPELLGLSEPMVLAGVIGTCILIPLLVVSLRWMRGLLTGWLFFFVAILPTMQIIGFSNVIASDKFAYLPSVGLLMVLASFLAWFCSAGGAGKLAVRRKVVVMVVLLLAGAEAVATRRYLVHWRDTVSLCEHMLTLTPGAVPVHNMLGYALQSQGKLDEATSHYRQVLQVKPNDTIAHNNLGSALQSQGKLDEAISHYCRVLQVEPNDAVAHHNLGNALKLQGKLNEAVSHYRQALQVKPDTPEVHNNLGSALKEQGETNQAIRHYTIALQLDPSHFGAHNNLAIILFRQGRIGEAIPHFQNAVRLNPGYAGAYKNLGIAFGLQGKTDEAISYFRKALQFRPDDAGIHHDLAVMLISKGLIDEAISEFREALRIDPTYEKARQGLEAVLEK